MSCGARIGVEAPSPHAAAAHSVRGLTDKQKSKAVRRTACASEASCRAKPCRGRVERGESLSNRHNSCLRGKCADLLGFSRVPPTRIELVHAV
jgi:hypothetical protein